MRTFKDDHQEDDHRLILPVDQHEIQVFLLRAPPDPPQESQEVDVLVGDQEGLRGLTGRKRADVGDDKKNFNLWMLRLIRQRMPRFLKVK